MLREKIKLSEDTIILQEFIEKQKNGQEIGYIDISQKTGIKMNSRGKQLLRTAIKRANKEFSTIRGWGIKLACTETVMPILSKKIVKIDRAVKRAEKTHKTLESQFFSQLLPDEQKQILFAGAVFGAIRIAAQNGKLLYQKNKPKAIGEVKIPIPQCM